MSGDVLDLIDGALEDWASADAMRWSPDPPEPGKFEFEPWHAAVMAEFGLEWQQRVLTAMAPASLDLGAALHQAYDSLGRPWPTSARGYHADMVLIDECVNWVTATERTRRTRLRRMRHLYRQRHR